MRHESQEKLNRIKKASVVFRAIAKGLVALTTLLGLGFIACVMLGIGDIDINGTVFHTGGLILSHRLLLSGVIAVAWAIALKGLYHLHRLFGDYSRGEVFTRDSAHQLRQFGVACLLWGIMSFLWLLSLAISSPPGKTYGGSSGASAIGTGLVIIVVAWFMDMAVDLREENDLTI